MAKNEQTNASQSDDQADAAQNESSEKAAEASQAPAAGDDATLKASDLEGLDLSIETVEERISPSETNVFDK